jgi:8-oxo-dGTP diphosphatase
MSSELYHIAVGVIYNEDRNKVLIAKRHSDVHQGGLWEFPGGKLENNEQISSALSRELLEEIGLVVDKARPLIRIKHDYPDQSVLLDVWRIDEWHGHLHGREGQPIEWVFIDELPKRNFPSADRAIINATCLPVFYQISPDPFTNIDSFIKKTETCLRAGTRLFQLRCMDIRNDSYLSLVNRLRILFDKYNAIFLINASPADAVALDVGGVHLNSARLLQINERPLSNDYWVAASCHNQTELEHAGSIGVDFVVLSPVCETSSHQDMKTIGWDNFRQLVEMSSIPVYALGGMQASHLDIAQKAGGQGIAMVSGIWSSADPGGVIRACISR